MSQNNYAIIEAGGKQHRIKVGQRFKIELIEGEAGDMIELGNIKMLANGDNVQLGTPHLEGKVSAKIVQHSRSKKVVTVKLRRRKGYRRKLGHRQHFTEVEIIGLPH